MKTADFDFRVPERLIPLTPPDLRGERRDHARLAVLNRAEQSIEHDRFDNLGAYLRAGDVLVVNDTLIVNDQLCGWGGNRRGGFKLITFRPTSRRLARSRVPCAPRAPRTRHQIRLRLVGGRSREADRRRPLARALQARRNLRLLRADHGARRAQPAALQAHAGAPVCLRQRLRARTRLAGDVFGGAALHGGVAEAAAARRRQGRGANAAHRTHGVATLPARRRGGR
jgi:hypothetical protein